MISRNRILDSVAAVAFSVMKKTLQNRRPLAEKKKNEPAKQSVK